jgi:hypothetical protein
MLTISAVKAQSRCGELPDLAQREPVAVARQGPKRLVENIVGSSAMAMEI